MLQSRQPCIHQPGSVTEVDSVNRGELVSVAGFELVQPERGRMREIVAAGGGSSIGRGRHMSWH